MTEDTQPDWFAHERKMSPAMLRMTRSRIALRQALQHGGDGGADKRVSEQLPDNTLDSLLGLLKGQPTAQLLVHAAQGIWAKNPWMILGKNAFEASNILLLPIAKRSPVKLVAGAFIVGALLCIARPWHLVKTNALFAGLFGR